jgi:hypothetical protein
MKSRSVLLFHEFLGLATSSGLATRGNNFSVLPNERKKALDIFFSIRIGLQN